MLRNLAKAIFACLFVALTKLTTVDVDIRVEVELVVAHTLIVTSFISFHVRPIFVVTMPRDGFRDVIHAKQTYFNLPTVSCA